MRRGLFILAVITLMALFCQDAHAAQKFGTRDSVQDLQDLAVKGPKGEAQSLGYVTTTHFFFMPYKMTGDYVLIVRGSWRDLEGRPRDVFNRLSQEQIAQMQRAGALPKPLPPYRHTIIDYLWNYMLWWFFPGTIALIMLFQKLRIGSRANNETRTA